MTETTNDRQNLDLATEIDDVEAHGLREVAAAATIGAAVVGAGGVALAAVHTPVPKTPAIVQQATDDTRDLANDATDATYELTGSVGSDAGRFGQHVAGSAHEIVGPRVETISSDVHSVAVSATDLASDASRLTARTVHSTEAAAGGVAKTAKTTATAKVSSVTKTTLRVVAATRSALDQGWDINVQAFGTSVSTGGDLLDPTGRVSITDAAGNVLASARLGNGACTLHVHAVGEHQTLTIHYPGDNAFTAVQLAWTPPVGF